MVPDTPPDSTARPGSCSLKAGVIVESPELAVALFDMLEDIHTTCVFQLPVSAAKYEAASAVGRERPEILFVELARIEGSGKDWIEAVRGGAELPLVIAIHSEPEPESMIEALRAGASEFLCLPFRPAVFEAMERIGALLEARQAETHERGRTMGFLSAKGGCGATTLACYFAACIQQALGSGKVLIADFDPQSPAAHRIAGIKPKSYLEKVFESVRRLHSSVWQEFVSTVSPGLDLLAGRDSRNAGGANSLAPEAWRIESLLRFLHRNYSFVLADLGRHLNPANWGFLQNVDELVLVTAPDVLALYQTRSILQTLAARGFEKSRVHLVLNRNIAGPRDFWVESIEQMFEMNVMAVIPEHAHSRTADHFEFPTGSPFGKAITKATVRLMKPGNEPGSKGAAKKAA